MKWLLFLIALSAQAENVLYRAPSQSKIDYQAALKAQSDLISPTVNYLRVHPLKENRERLNSLFAEAQKAFLRQDKNSAHTAFQNVVDLLAIDDWRAADRSVLALSYFRLAQLENEGSRQDFWLQKILALGSDATVDSNLVPPPLLQRFKELRMKTSVRDLSRVLGEWDSLLINGWACMKCEFPKTSEPVRITWLSDQWQPVTQMLTVAALSDAPVGKTWPLPPPSQPLNLKVQEHPNTLPLFAQTRMEKPLWKSPWLWAALGGVVATVLVVEHNRHHSDPAPTTTYGY